MSVKKLIVVLDKLKIIEHNQILELKYEKCIHLGY